MKLTSTRMIAIGGAAILIPVLGVVAPVSVILRQDG